MRQTQVHGYYHTGWLAGPSYYSLHQVIGIQHTNSTSSYYLLITDVDCCLYVFISHCPYSVSLLFVVFNCSVIKNEIILIPEQPGW